MVGWRPDLRKWESRDRFQYVIDRQVLLRLIRRSNVEPKCGNNMFLVSPRSFVVSLFHLSLYRLCTVDGPCSATYCEPAKQYQVFRGRSEYLPRQGQSSICLWGVSSYFASPCSKIRFKGSRWTVEVQRLLQPTRELMRSGYETRLRVKELLLPGD